MVWIIGEYADRIDESREMLESFLENFKADNGGDVVSTIHAVFKTFSEYCLDTVRDRPLEVRSSSRGVPSFSPQGLPTFSLASSCLIRR